MTETEELTIRRDTLKGELARARRDALVRESERAYVLADLQTQRDQLLATVKELRREVDEFENSVVALEDEWKTARREAASATRHLESLKEQKK